MLLLMLLLVLMLLLEMRSRDWRDDKSGMGDGLLRNERFGFDLDLRRLLLVHRRPCRLRLGVKVDPVGRLEVVDVPQVEVNLALKHVFDQTVAAQKIWIKSIA